MLPCITNGLLYKSTGLLPIVSIKRSTAAMALPPFPEDVLTHPLLVVDYQKLKEDDTAEIDKLWQAATSLGFW